MGASLKCAVNRGIWGLSLFPCLDEGHGPVGQHRLASQVANRPHIAHAGMATAVDAYRRTVHRHRILLHDAPAGCASPRFEVGDQVVGNLHGA